MIEMQPELAESSVARALPNTDADLEHTLERLAALVECLAVSVETLSRLVDELEKQLAENRLLTGEHFATLSTSLDAIIAQTTPPEPVARKRGFDLRSLWPVKTARREATLNRQ